MQQQIKQCAVYTRKSTEEGLEQDFNSLDAQREACLAYITSQKIEGWRAVKTEYSDGGFSGGNMNRPALEKLIKDIKAGKVDIVVVYKIDRLTRSLMDFSKLVEVFDEHNVTFVSITQSFNTTTSMGRLTLNVLLSFAQFEREVTGERIRDKIAASKKKGMWMGGVPPVGYRIENHQLVPEEQEIKIAQHIFNRYLALESVGELKRELEYTDIKSPVRISQKGNQYGGLNFSRGALYAILKNPAYIGKIAHKDKIYDSEHEPIIDLDIWQLVQDKLDDNRTTRANITKQRHVLQGLLFDFEGTPYSPTFTKKKNKQYRYYISQNLLQYKNHPNGLIARLPSHEIEKLIEQGVRDNIKAMIEGDYSAYVLEHLCEIDSYNLIRACLKKAVVSIDNVELFICGNGLKKLVEKHLKVSVDVNRAELKVSLPYRARRGDKGSVIIEQSGNEDVLNMPKDKLKKLVQGIIWRDEHFNGRAISEIARTENKGPNYVRECIYMSFNCM